MKIFTRISLFAIACLLSTGAFAQVTPDLEITAMFVSSSANNTVPENFQSSIYFGVENIGPAIDSTMNIDVEAAITVNGTPIAGGPWTPGINNWTNGGVIAFPFALNQIAYYTFEPPTPSFEVCVYAYATGEVDSSSNQICETITINPNVSNDWSCDLADIVSPTNLDGFDIDSDPNTTNNPIPELDTVNITITNNGSIEYVAFTRASFQVALDEDTVQLFGTSQNIVGNGDNMNFFIGDPASLPVMIADSGTWEVCGITNALGDDVPENNTSCDQFTIIDTYNPFAQGNWPTGQEEVEGELLNIVPTLDRIMIQGVENSTVVTVTDMQGRIIEISEIQENASIKLDDQSAGMYIIQATDQTTGETQMRKVSK
jgi:hypothetical protein